MDGDERPVCRRVTRGESRPRYRGTVESPDRRRPLLRPRVPVPPPNAPPAGGSGPGREEDPSRGGWEDSTAEPGPLMDGTDPRSAREVEVPKTPNPSSIRQPPPTRLTGFPQIPGSTFDPSPPALGPPVGRTLPTTATTPVTSPLAHTPPLPRLHTPLPSPIAHTPPTLAHTPLPPHSYTPDPSAIGGEVLSVT